MSSIFVSKVYYYIFHVVWLPIFVTTKNSLYAAPTVLPHTGILNHEQQALFLSNTPRVRCAVIQPVTNLIQNHFLILFRIPFFYFVIFEQIVCPGDILNVDDVWKGKLCCANFFEVRERYTTLILSFTFCK